MDIKTLESFKLSDAVTFHNQLNPKLFVGQRLLPKVKNQLLLIAKDFTDNLGIRNLNIKDITISGSNAAYSYTPHSDLDLHIIVDMSNINNDDVYRELFNAKKTIYNDSHNITVHGIPVELYVQDEAEPVKSLGEYSLLQDKWLRYPTKRRANLDQNATKAKFDKLEKLIHLALKSKNLKKILEVLKTIKRYRQAGLEKGGEFGPENLAFKALRSQGLITKLYALKDKLHSEKLTIETMYQTITDEDYDPTYNVGEDSSMQFAAEKTPPINPYGGRKDRQYRGGISEASGYIPSEKEKNDPRFKTALTVDVKPNTIKKNAKAFGFNTSRAGIPPILKTSGNI
jgi:hypothetical protein